jgi:dephospho-CoA kinase
MKLLGLTGGIGTGKSTVAKLISKRGIPVVDTDDLARELVSPGQSTLTEVTRCFGTEILDERGELRRGALASIVFSAPEKLKQLEAILHPRIREAWLKESQRWREAGQGMGVVVIPLLFETEAQSHFQSILCTACSKGTQLERLRSRGWSDEQIQQRLAVQWPLEKKMAASHYVLWTEGELPILERQLERIIP